MQPRYHVEMALLRWIHLRRLTPLADLIQQVQGGPSREASAPGAGEASRAATVKAVEARRPPSAAPAGGIGPGRSAAPAGDLKAAFLAEIRRAKKFFHGTVVAQAQRIDLDGDRFVFVFGAQHRALRIQLEQNRPWLESTATELARRKMTVAAAEGSPSPARADSGQTVPAQTPQKAAVGGDADRRQELKERAMSDTAVQTMLDVFAAEIKDIEEM